MVTSPRRCIPATFSGTPPERPCGQQTVSPPTDEGLWQRFETVPCNIQELHVRGREVDQYTK